MIIAPADSRCCRSTIRLCDGHGPAYPVVRAALLPVSLLPAMVGVGGRVYTVSAVLLGVMFFAFAFPAPRGRTRVEARRLFFASIIYLPVLLAVLMMDQR